MKGFKKVVLGPGETTTVRLTFDMRALAFFDVSRKALVAEAGSFTLFAGFSSADIVAQARFMLRETWIDGGSQRAGGI